MEKECPVQRKKRNLEAILRKVEERKSLIAAPNSSRVDMTKVHGILGGPRLTWDWSSTQGARARVADDDEDNDGGLVVDCAQDTRSALKTHISRAMSQMATASVGNKSTSPEELQAILESKRARLGRRESQQSMPATSNMSCQETQKVHQSLGLTQHQYISQNHTQEVVSEISETQVVVDVSPTQVVTSRSVFLEAHEETSSNLFRVGGTTSPTQLAEIVCDDDEPCMTATQVIHPIDRPVEHSFNPLARRQDTGDSVGLASMPSSAAGLPPDMIEVEDIDTFLNSKKEEEEVDVESEDSESVVSEAPVIPKIKSKKRQVEFEEWLAERRRLKQKRKTKSTGQSSTFIEAEAEESEDENLGSILRGRGAKSDDDSDMSSDSDDSDLDDLVASAEDEFNLFRKQNKDSRRVARMHAKWAAERDEALEKAIEEKDFLNRKNRTRAFTVEDGGSIDGLSRLQRKLKQKRDAYVQQFDGEGNLLAPDIADESDYDSMEIDSDEFYDEFSDDGDDTNLTAEEKAAREELLAKVAERRKRDAEFKAEMNRRRTALKEKLREERIQREKDKREIQAGLTIMTEEDRETFKMINRVPQTFSGIVSQASTTASTPAPAESGFSFLGTATKSFTTITSQRRRSSIGGSLELE
jgi:hypothetical protein